MFSKKRDQIEEIEKKPAKEKKPKKEKQPLDEAAKRKRKKIIIFSVIGVVILLIVLLKIFGGNGAQAVVTTAEAATGEIEQTINTSGTVTTENTKSYFSDVNVKIGSIPVKKGDAVKAGV